VDQKKTCFKCGRELPLSDFYRHPQMADGLLGKCKGCTRTDVLLRRREKIEAVRAYDRERAKTPKRRANAKRITRRQRREAPEKSRAQRIVAYHVRKGNLVPKPCEACGRTDNVHAHHDDYSHPLDVHWLCPPCHSARHLDSKV
jgi:hypothetical protein